jgi:hypothetical protein
VIVAYIDSYRGRFGVEPICRVLTEHQMPIAPSTYYAALARRVSAHQLAEAYLVNAAVCLFEANRGVYGVRKLWQAMVRAGHQVGRDQVGRLMRIGGLCGAVRGRHATTTTRRDGSAPRHPDLIGRAWDTPTRPDQWWVADIQCRRRHWKSVSQTRFGAAAAPVKSWRTRPWSSTVASRSSWTAGPGLVDLPRRRWRQAWMAAIEHNRQTRFCDATIPRSSASSSVRGLPRVWLTPDL